MKLRLLFILIILSLSAGNSLKGQNRKIDGIDQYRFYVKLRKEARADIENGEVRLFSQNRARSHDLLAKLNSRSFKQLVPFTEDEKINLRCGTRSGNSKNKFNKSDFSGLLELTSAPSKSFSELLSLAEELETYDIVEYCEISPLHTPAPNASIGDTLFTLPFKRNAARASDYTAGQFYLYGDQGDDIIGIYADYAWSIGITGQGVSFADIEWGWDYEHEEFINQNCFDVIETQNHDYDDHGTAVLGEMYAADNGSGVVGAVHGADAFYGFSEITEEGGRPGAIIASLDSLEEGDILVYEMQAAGEYSNHYVPADFRQTIWDLTKQASDAGIIVVAAAGNGKQNLDWDYYKSYLARGDNGSIIVGAATKVGRNRADFSTLGSRVDLCGYGDWSIYSTGYGDLHDDGPHATYTSHFSGTSSSTPIVASAAIAVQSYAKKKLGKVLGPIEMRDLLKETGTPSGTDWTKNTPLPNIKAAIEKLNEIYSVPTAPVKEGASVSPLSLKASLANQTISLQASVSGLAKVELFDLQGRKLFSSVVDITAGSVQLPLHFSLSGGVYLVSLETDKGVITQKIYNF